MHVVPVRGHLTPIKGEILSSDDEVLKKDSFEHILPYEFSYHIHAGLSNIGEKFQRYLFKH